MRLINNVCDYSAAEHVSAVTFAMKNKMNLSINIAISSSLQIGLFVTPVLVIAGWIFGQPMTLFFENFETVILFASVLIVNYLIQDGVSNWLEGTLLLVGYPLVSFIFIFLTQMFFCHRPLIPLLPLPSGSTLFNLFCMNRHMYVL